MLLFHISIASCLRDLKKAKGKVGCREKGEILEAKISFNWLIECVVVLLSVVLKQLMWGLSEGFLHFSCSVNEIKL